MKSKKARKSKLPLSFGIVEFTGMALTFIAFLWGIMALFALAGIAAGDDSPANYMLGVFLPFIALLIVASICQTIHHLLKRSQEQARRITRLIRRTEQLENQLNDERSKNRSPIGGPDDIDNDNPNAPHGR